LEIPAFDRLIDAIVFFNARDVPTDHLRDRVAVCGVEPFELWNGNLGQVMVQGSAGARLDGLSRRDRHCRRAGLQSGEQPRIDKDWRVAMLRRLLISVGKA
jgi:hypothetical protein